MQAMHEKEEREGKSEKMMILCVEYDPSSVTNSRSGSAKAKDSAKIESKWSLFVRFNMVLEITQDIQKYWESFHTIMK